MRRWQFISITVLLFFVSCRNSIVVDSLTKVRPEFVSVYDLKDNYPESAYHVFVELPTRLMRPNCIKNRVFYFMNIRCLRQK